MSEALKRDEAQAVNHLDGEPDLRLLDLDRSIFRPEQTRDGVSLSAVLIAAIAVPVVAFLAFLVFPH